MKKILIELLTFVLFVASIVCFYLSITAFFYSVLLNIICFFTGVFLLIQASGLVDKTKGFGQTANNQNSNSNSNSNTQEQITHNDSNDAPTYEGDDEI